MRIPIAVQLGLLVLVTALVGLAVLSIATWVNNYNFVVDVQSDGLELVAKIKARQIASNLQLLESTCKTIVTRLLIQGALGRFYNGNSSDSNWTSSVTDVQSALGSNNYTDLYKSLFSLEMAKAIDTDCSMSLPKILPRSLFPTLTRTALLSCSERKVSVTLPRSTRI